MKRIIVAAMLCLSCLRAFAIGFSHPASVYTIRDGWHLPYYGEIRKSRDVDALHVSVPDFGLGSFRCSHVLYVYDIHAKDDSEISDLVLDEYVSIASNLTGKSSHYEPIYLWPGDNFSIFIQYRQDGPNGNDYLEAFAIYGDGKEQKLYAFGSIFYLTDGVEANKETYKEAYDSVLECFKRPILSFAETIDSPAFNYSTFFSQYSFVLTNMLTMLEFSSDDLFGVRH